MDKYIKKEDIENLYDENPNNLSSVFLSAGYNEDYVQKMFNSASKEVIVIRAMKILEKINEEKILKDDDLYQIPKKYNVPENKFLKDDRNDMYIEMNNSISKKTGEILQSLYDYDSDEYVIGIHRTASDVNQIFSKGIIYKNLDLYDHVQLFSNFPFFLREIKYCESYKFSRGCFIIKIPKKDVKGLIENANPIFYKNKDGNIYLKPDFICAYVPVHNRNIGNIILNTENHDIYYNNTEFYYNEQITDVKKLS